MPTTSFYGDILRDRLAKSKAKLHKTVKWLLALATADFMLAGLNLANVVETHDGVLRIFAGLAAGFCAAIGMAAFLTWNRVEQTLASV